MYWNVDKIPKQKNELLMMWIMWQSLGHKSIQRKFLILFLWALYMCE
jgi:hypothetical protein